MYLANVTVSHISNLAGTAGASLHPKEWDGAANVSLNSVSMQKPPHSRELYHTVDVPVVTSFF